MQYWMYVSVWRQSRDFFSFVKVLSWGGLVRNLRLTVKLVTRAFSALHGLRPLLISSVPQGGSVQQDQCLDTSQVHYLLHIIRGQLTFDRCSLFTSPFSFYLIWFPDKKGKIYLVISIVSYIYIHICSCTALDIIQYVCTVCIVAKCSLKDIIFLFLLLIKMIFY